MAYLCPECGYEQDEAGDCPSCQVPLEPMDEEGDEDDDADEDEE